MNIQSQPKKIKLSSLFRQYYRKLAQIRNQRLNLLKKIDQQAQNKKIVEIEQKIKDL